MADAARPSPGTLLAVPLEERTVLHVLRGAAGTVADRIAVVDQDRRLTYAQLYAESLAVAAGLAARGIGHGDRVLIYMENHIDHVTGWFGANLAGATAVPVNTAMRGEQLAYVVNHSEARIVLVDAEHLPRFEHVADQLPEVTNILVRGDHPTTALTPQVEDLASLHGSPPITPVELRPWDTLGVMYTSGTTGRSKGVLVTQAQTYGRMWPLQVGAAEPGDVTLVSLPIFHVIGQCRGLYNTLIAHGTAVLERRFSASRFLDTCREHGITYVPLVGAMASYLLAQPEREDDDQNPVERICIGTTIPEVARFAERFGVELTTSYGLTEVGGVLVGPARASGCGYLRSDYEAELVDEYDRPVPTGEVGELVLRGREPWTVMAGYLKNPEATAEKWRNLWLHTGDLMRQRDDGEFVFVGRRTESIRRKGENISLMEVERGLLAHPGVHEAAAVGVRVDGEVELKAVLVPEPDATLDLEELVGFLAEEMAYFMVPRYFVTIDRLPRTESTHRVQRQPLEDAGLEGVWDREAAGLLVTREGLRRRVP